MDELDKLLAEGKITASEYARLVRQQTESQSADYRKSEVLEAAAGIQQFYKSHLGIDPSDIASGQPEYQMSMSPEELETYTSRGITPSTYRDYEDDRAEAQSFADKLGNGLTKLIGKSATAVAGGIGMVPSIAANVAGQLEDIVNGDNTSFHEIYDNFYYRALDEANAAMDEALPHYVTREEENASLLNSLGTANFWTNDFLQGASFVIGAIATEGLMTLGAEASGLRNLTRTLDAVKKGTKVDDIAGLMGRSATAQTGYEAVTLGRQIMTGAGYESSVEALSFVKDAERQWLDNYRSQHLEEPTEEEYAKAMEEIYSVANGVFGMNMLVVGTTQAKTLPGLFAPKLANSIRRVLGKGEIAEASQIIQTSKLSAKQLDRAAKNLGKTVDEVKAIPNIAKEATYSKLGKITSRTARGLEGAVFEGGQEGLQKAISYSALDYLNDRMDPAANEDFMDSWMYGLTKAFGNNAESWKEIFIGALLGSVGGPGGKGGWQGGIYEGFRDRTKSENFQNVLNLANNYSKNSEGILNNYLKHWNLTLNLQDKKDRAYDKNDMYDYHSQEAKEVFNYLNFMKKMGRLSEVDEQLSDSLNKLNKKQFEELYGYKNLTNTEFTKRKAELSQKIAREISDVSESADKGASIYRGGDQDVLDGIAYTIYAHKNADNRESKIAEEVSKLVGIIDPRSLVEISRDNQRLKLKDGWLYTYKSKLKGLKAAKKVLENRMLSGSVNKKDVQIDELEKKIKQKEKELKALLKEEYNTRKALRKSPITPEYELDYDEFEEKVNKQAEFLEKLEKHYETDGIDKSEIEQKLADLKKLARDREKYIGEFNRLLTSEGLKELETSIEGLRKEFAKEQIDVTTMSIMEVERAKKASERVYKAQELAFKLRGANKGVEVEQEATPENKIKALDQIIENLPEGPGKDLLKTAVKQVYDKLLSKDITNIESYLDNIYTELFNDESLNTPGYKDTLDTIRGVFNEIVTYLKAPKSKSVINSIDRFFKIYVPKDKKKEIGDYLANTFTHHSEFNVEIEKLDKDDPYIKEQEAKNRITFIEDADKNKILTPFMGLQTLIKRNGEYYAIKVFHNDMFIGYILDPNRYKFRNPDTGAYEDFNKKSLAHLRLINPAFVTNGTITEEGQDFIEAYEKGREMFSYFEQAIDSGKSKFTAEELSGSEDSIGYFKSTNQFDEYNEGKPGELLEQLRNSPEIYNIIPLDDENGIQVHNGVFVKAPFVQVNIGGYLDYYYYDKASDKFKKVDYQEGVDKLNRILNVSGSSSKFRVDRPGYIKLIVPNNETNKFSSISIELPNVPIDEKDSQFINDFKDWMNTFSGIDKDEWKSKYKDNSDKLSKGLYFPVNVLGFNNTGDTIKVRIYPQPVSKSGKQFILVETVVNGQVGSTILDSFDELNKYKSAKQLIDKINRQIHRIQYQKDGNDVYLVPKPFKVTGFNYITRDASEELSDALATGIPSLLVSRGISYQPYGLNNPENNSKKKYTKTETTDADEETNGFTASSFGIPPAGERFEFNDDDDQEDQEEQKDEKDDEKKDDDNLSGFSSYDDDNDIPFSIQQELSKYEESIESRQANVDNLLPSWIPVKELNELSKKFKNKGFTYGVFIDNAIYLAKNAPKGVEYHEAFHAVFRALLNDLQISKVYSEAKVKYGVPSKEQLQTLKGLSNRYKNLNTEQLTNLWYEEKLADEFQSFMLKPVEPKSFIQKIFDKIKKFIDWLTGNKNYIDYLFNDIKNGVYSNAKPVKNKFYQNQTMVFKTLGFEEEYNGQKRKRTLDSRTTSNIINKVLKRSFDVEKTGTLTNIDIKNIIEDLKNNYYTEENFEPLFEKANISKVQSAKRLISQIQNALSNEQNISEITKEVKNLIEMYKIVDYTLEEDDDQDSNDSPTEFFAKEAYSIGGVGSLSKEMRKYLQFIPSPVDELDLDVEIDPNSQYTAYADSFELYNGIARILANRKPADIIKALYSQSRSSQQIKYFTNQLFYDIAKDLKLQNASLSKIANLPLLQLADSTTFNMFVANFRKNKIDYVSITPDVENNRFKLFYSNANDIKSLQVNEWGNANLSDPVSSTQQNTILNELVRIFDNSKKGTYGNISEENFNQEVEKINNLLEKLHIRVDKMYIKMSLFNSLPNKQDLAAKASDETSLFYNLNETLGVYSDLTYLDYKLLKDINTATRTANGSIYERVDGDDRTGAIGKLELIAEANSYFDFTIIPTTFRNIEGKTIYSYIQPNYFVDVLNSFKNNAEFVIESINSVDVEEGYLKFRSFLEQENLESNDYLQRHFYNALRNNPMLTSGDGMSFISNLSPLLLDGSRVITMDAKLKELTYLSEDDGKTFQSLDPRGKILTYFFLYSTPKDSSGRNSVAKTIKYVSDEEVYVPYLPFQNEGKNGQYPVMMPKINYYSAGKLIDDVYNKFFKIFQLEKSNIENFFSSVKNNTSLPKVKGYNNFVVKNQDDAEFRDSFIQAVKNNDVKTILDAYSDNNLYQKLPRSLKFSNLNYLNEIGQLNDLITSALNGTEFELTDSIKSSIDLLIDNLLNETLELISSNKVKLINKIDENRYSNILLPKEFLFNNKEVNLQAVKNFLINDYINSASLMNMVLGDMTIAFKDAVDFPKRMAGMAAAGPSLGVSKTNVTIIKDILKTITGKKPKESTDGQSYSTQTWYERKYLRTFKKWNPEIERIYKKMRKCQKLSWSEKELLENYGALANSRKIAMFNYALYGKTSINPIVRNEVSFVRKENYKAVDKLVEKLYKTKNENEYKSILKQLQGYYEPYAQTKQMHDLLNKMEQSEIDIAIHESAVKTVIYNTQELDQKDNFESITMGDTFIREQVVTDNMKTKIVDGTQLLQLIDSEQDPSTIVEIYGKKVSIGTVVSAFKNTKAYRIKQSYDALKKSYYDKGKPRYKALLKSFRESLLTMGTDPIMLELISQTENLDSSKFNLNMNRTMKSVEKMLYSYLSASLSHKVSGSKFTLLSDYSYKVIEDNNGNIVTMDKYKENPKGDYSDPRDLEVKYDKDKNCYYAECLISPQTAYRYGLKPGDEIEVTNKKLLEAIGVRIPTQEKSSMVYLRVVDYLPIEKGNSIILPFEIMFYSGADFDIDSLFAQTLETYSLNNKEIAYGDYLNKEDEDSILESAFLEYYNESSNFKSVKADYDKFLDEDEEYTKLLQSAEYSEKELQIASLENIYDLIYFTSTELPDYKDEIKNIFENEGLTEAIRFIHNNTTYKEITSEKIAQFKKIANSIKEIKKSALTAAMKRNGYITTVEDFKLNKSLVKQVLNNHKVIKSGDILSYKPITNFETNNFMMEMKSVLIKNEGNKEASLRDVERDDAEKLTELLAEYGIKDSTKISHYVSLASKIKMSIANAVGGKNIGIAATGLIMAQYLMKEGVDLGNVGIASDFKWGGNENPVNKILSLWISLGVDNAKHQDAGRFNISSDMQSILVIDAITNKENINYSSKHIMALGLVPRVAEMLNAVSFTKDAFKTKEENKNSASKFVILHPNNKKPTSVNWDNLTLDEILTNISRLEKEGNIPELEDFQQAATNKVIDLTQIADYTFNFTQLLSLIKGNKISTSENFKILDALNNLGIEVINDNGNYYLQNTNEYHYYNDNSSTGLSSEHPVDFLRIIESDPFLKDQIITFYKLLEDSGMFLIASSEIGREIYNRVIRNLKPKAKADETKINKLISTMINTLAFKAIRLKNKQDNKLEVNPKTTFITDSVEDVPEYIKTFNELKNSKQLKNNFFLRNLKASFVEGRDRSPLENKVVHYISTNSRLNLSSNMKKRIADDMFNLYAGNVFNEDGSLNQNLSNKAKKFVAILLNQIYQKDAGMFINETILPYVEPFFLTNYSSALDRVQDAIAGNTSLEEAIGMDKEEFIKEFIESYTRNFNNLIDVKGNRIDYIHSNITNALINEIDNVEDKADIEDSDIDDILKKLIAIRDARESNEKIEKDIYDLISPFEFNKDKSGFTLSLSPRISKEDKTSFFFDNDRRKTLSYLYRKALAKTGIVNPVYVIDNNKRYKKLEFLDTIVITIPRGDENIRRVYKLVNIERGKNPKSDNPYFGWQAQYVEVTPFGSKAYSNFYYTPKESESIFSTQTTKSQKKEEKKDETKVKKEIKPEKKVEVKSETLKNLYEFFSDNMEGLLDLLDINSYDEFSKDINSNIKEIFDKIISNGRMDTMKQLAKTKKSAGGGLSYTLTGSEEFLKFADAYENNKLNELITICKTI